MAMQARSWIGLLCGVLAIGLLGIPAATAHPSRIPLAEIVPAASARLFWYIPALDIDTSPQRINAVAYDPSNPGVALASEGNPGGVILRSVDHGLTWSRSPGWNRTPPSIAFHVVFGQQPGTYYAWAGTRIFKTSDSGLSWTSIPYNTSCNQILTMAVDPANPAILYVGTTNGFARSLDGGQTWSAPNPFFCQATAGPYASSIAIASDQPNIVYAGQRLHYDFGIWRSLDHGATWEWRPNDLETPGGGYAGGTITALVDPRDSNIVYTLVVDGTVYKTSDAGLHWSLLNQGIESVKLTSLTFDARHGNTLYAASTDHLYRLADGAQSWQEVDTEPIPQISSFPYDITVQLDPSLAQRPIAFDDIGLFVGLPIPAITAVRPAVAPIGTRDFTLTVEGHDFTPAALVRWNGQERPTTFISDTRLSAVISATDVVTTGIVPISVGYHRNYPYASDGASNTLPFSIQPACAVDGHTAPNDACAMTVTPGIRSTLVYTSTPNLVTTIDVPAGSVAATTVLSYTAVPTAVAPAGFSFAGLSFSLDAYRGNAKVEGFAFAHPISITVQYGDIDIAGMDERRLILDYRNGTAWVDAATTCAPPSTYQRALDLNRFSVAVCHLTQFGVFGIPQRKLYLPLVRR